MLSFKLKRPVVILFLMLGFFNIAYALNIDKVKVNFLSGDYRQAISEGEKLISRDEYSSELRYFLGVSYLKEGDYQRSADYFKAVINNFKDSKFKEESRIGLADSYLLREDFSNARALYQELINENPKSKFKGQILARLSDLNTKSTNGLQCDLEASYYSVQVGSFSDINNAKNLTQKLVRNGYPAYMEGNKTAYRVKVGKLKTRKLAEELSRRLAKQGYPTKICP
jgi:tetratricopeptide (TPR) repeat protein